MKTCQRFASALLIALLLGFAVDLKAQTDSLADVFPLAVGNQWTYRYSAEWIDALDEECWIDTGNVILRVVQQIASSDSIRWGLEQRRYLQRRTAATFCGPPIFVSNISDTTTFEIVELLSGQHQVYRSENWIQNLPEIFPFSKQHTDTTTIFRYRKVDGTKKATFLSKPDWMVNSTFIFRKGVGMERYQSTGYPATGLLLTVDHQLRSSTVLAVDDGTNLLNPRDFTLHQNYPNPFNPTTTISYSLGHRSPVSLKVFDVLGREVTMLVDEVQEAGFKMVEFNAEGLASGVYFYRLQAGDASSGSAQVFVGTRKLLLMR